MPNIQYYILHVILYFLLIKYDRKERNIYQISKNGIKKLTKEVAANVELANESQIT